MKRITVVAAVFLVCMMVGSAYAAQDLTGKHALGIATGMIFTQDECIGNSWYAGGNYTYNIDNNFAVGAEVGYMRWNDEAGGIDYGDVRAVPLLADFYLRYPIDVSKQMFLPYAVGGIGVIFWNYDENSVLKDAGISIDMGTELGIKGGVGFDYFFTEKVAFNLEGSYVWSNADMTVSYGGATATNEFDTDYWALTGGMKYYF